MIRNAFIMLFFIATACNTETKDFAKGHAPYVPFEEPKHYVCLPIDQVRVDGNLSEWTDIEWTDFFVDIEGDEKPEPRHKTRAKMAWDENYLYIAAELKEPHVWAKLRQRDTVIFYDNDFEVFIDPDGDTHHYYELEINALETAWDLLLTMPYRDFGHVIDSWDILGLEVGVEVHGTLNNPDDQDESWTVELALPFAVLEECNYTGDYPKSGDYWRINFSRVEWQTEIVNGQYIKKSDTETGKHLPEDNWVWSPQYHINMHMPEYWGFLVFADQDDPVRQWEVPQHELIKWDLRNVYYMQRVFFQEHEEYASSAAGLNWSEMAGPDKVIPDIQLTFTGYQASFHGDEGYLWVINEKGLVRRVQK